MCKHCSFVSYNNRTKQVGPCLKPAQWFVSFVENGKTSQYYYCNKHYSQFKAYMEREHRAFYAKKTKV